MNSFQIQPPACDSIYLSGCYANSAVKMLQLVKQKASIQHLRSDYSGYTKEKTSILSLPPPPQGCNTTRNLLITTRDQLLFMKLCQQSRRRAVSGGNDRSYSGRVFYIHCKSLAP